MVQAWRTYSCRSLGWRGVARARACVGKIGVVSAHSCGRMYVAPGEARAAPESRVYSEAAFEWRGSSVPALSLVRTAVAKCTGVWTLVSYVNCNEN